MSTYRGLARQLRVRGGYFSVFPHSAFLRTRLDCFHSTYRPLVFFALDAKGGERVCRFRGSCERVLVLLCVLHSCMMFTYLHLHCMIYVLMRYSHDMLCFIVFIFYHVTCLVFSSYALLLCSTPISYELYYHVLISLVLSNEYIMLA
jgi:hypothetical protein